MAEILLPTPTPPDLDRAAPEAALAGLRAELDRLDDALHDLLMRRAAVVECVADLRGKPSFRAGREAAILRRLIARHHGRLPAQTVVRMWREMLAGTTAMQGAWLISVCEAGTSDVAAALAREHFGALTPLHVHRTPAQALREVGAGIATAAVLPVPTDGGGEADAWWTALLHQDGPRIHVVAKLPFWTPRPEGFPRGQALVAAAAPPDPSGDDRTLIGVEIAADFSRTRFAAALTAACLPPNSMIRRRAASVPVAQVLIETDGLVAEADARLAAIPGQRPPVVLGAYAAPLEGQHG